jgi:hypothetical protein
MMAQGDALRKIGLSDGLPARGDSRFSDLMNTLFAILWQVSRPAT